MLEPHLELILRDEITDYKYRNNHMGSNSMYKIFYVIVCKKSHFSKSEKFINHNISIIKKSEPKFLYYSLLARITAYNNKPNSKKSKHLHEVYITLSLDLIFQENRKFIKNLSNSASFL